ncbi:MAG: alpha/beta hydrolase [Oleibacter sp.]|nr:alpha/beta hydrolase [Thalassolituus sp.]
MYKNYTSSGNPDDPLFIFAHGAGADSQSDFMSDMAQRIAAQGIYIVRFDFPYMLKRQQDGKKRPPDKGQMLELDWFNTIADLDRNAVIGGKSMGGRIASMVANHSLVTELTQEDEKETKRQTFALIKGCACLGYPFHPIGKPEKHRTEHLRQLQLPTLIVQGTRDTMGTYEDVAGYTLDPQLEILWLEDGNHDLKPRKNSGFTLEEHLQRTAIAVADFVKRHNA